MPSIISFNADASGNAAVLMTVGTVDTTFIPISGMELAAVPEPATLGLLGLAFGGLMMVRRRRK